MSQLTNLAIFDTSHEAAISWINQQLISIGLIVKPSFDLKTAKSAHTDCACPHHGTVQCDCQIVVLLVFGENEGPISLVVHSQDGRTNLSMTLTSGDGRDDGLTGKIFHTLGYQNIHSS